ncbi:MAG TPA: hypothetical protein VF521_15930 [Pyrinomonadaceae bacterium]
MQVEAAEATEEDLPADVQLRAQADHVRDLFELVAERVRGELRGEVWMLADCT